MTPNEIRCLDMDESAPMPESATKRLAPNESRVRRSLIPYNLSTCLGRNIVMTVIGMIGAGRWGSNWIRTLAAMPNVDLRWCCDLSESSLERVAQQFPKVKTTSRLDDLLEDKGSTRWLLPRAPRPILT